ncbi:MAG: 2-oxo acid dehydrogenase subunit E2, partial [Candidatus Aminicenantes bacterium]|nr:2-oxo acid dehydrogenase subunit E2 [Candidatus Aminicenantes bacterium]
MIFEVIMPVLGLTMEKGKIVRWLKKEGEYLEKGEPLLEVETDKVTMEVASEFTGTLAKILVGEGQEVPVATVIAIIADEADVSATIEKYKSIPLEVSSPDIPSKLAYEISTGRDETSETVKASPLAKKLASLKGIDITKIKGSGPKNRILEKDILAYEESLLTEKILPLKKDHVFKEIDKKGDLPEPFGEKVPLSSTRRIIAQKMAKCSHDVPHIFFETKAEASQLIETIDFLNKHYKKNENIEVSINDLLIKIVALCIQGHPLFNSSFTDEGIMIHPHINIGIAVALPDGLVVPAIGIAERKNIFTISAERRELVERARIGKLTLEEIERGTFTITSLAHYDIKGFIPIINPPQSGILSVGKIEKTPVVKNDSVVISPMLFLGLNCDHRIIDG